MKAILKTQQITLKKKIGQLWKVVKLVLISVI